MSLATSERAPVPIFVTDSNDAWQKYTHSHTISETDRYTWAQAHRQSKIQTDTRQRRKIRQKFMLNRKRDRKATSKKWNELHKETIQEVNPV